MGFNFHVGLPGPFSYTRRIGGSTHRKPRPVTKVHVVVAWTVVVVLTLMSVGIVGPIGLLVGAFFALVLVRVLATRTGGVK